MRQCLEAHRASDVVVVPKETPRLEQVLALANADREFLKTKLEYTEQQNHLALL